MSEKLSSSSQKARDEALRALVTQGGLTPEQVSELKLSQVHLSTSTLVIEPDEFDPATAATERPINLKLDDAMRRALIAWLVVRPDGPNQHLFPGTGGSGLDVGSINQVVAADKPVKIPETSEDAAAPGRAEGEKPGGLADSVPSTPARVEKEEKPVPPSRPIGAGRQESGAVPLDEIEALRKRLAETYDAWAPAVSAAAAKPVARPGERRDVTSAPAAGAGSPAETPGAETAPEPADIASPGERTMPARAPVTEPGRVPITPARPAPIPQAAPAQAPASAPERIDASEALLEPSEEPGVAVSVSPPAAGLGGRLRGVWGSSEGKIAFNLPYRTTVLAGLAVLLVVCCLGLAIASGVMLGSGSVAGLLPGATPIETQMPTAVAPSATATLSPSPTGTATPTLTSAPSATFTALPAPTNTQAPTSTPVVIVVTATPTPEPSPTATRVPTNTPEGGAPPEPTPTETPGFKYAAPVLVWPEDGSTVPGVINILQWEPVGPGPLADDEWYAIRLVYRQQGQLVYAGDRVKIAEWRVPDRLYYQADGPDLEYSWYLFVERDNPDGTTTQLSPDSETFIFRWE